MKTVSFNDEAREEFLAAVARYEAIEQGLGERFNLAIQAVVGRASRFPEGGVPGKFGTRRMTAKNFPYSVVYRDEEHAIVVLAVAHFRRSPNYWRGRKRGG